MIYYKQKIILINSIYNLRARLEKNETEVTYVLEISRADLMRRSNSLPSMKQLEALNLCSTTGIWNKILKCSRINE
ncbi:Pappalysin-1 [Dirofilaria immitis]